MIGLVIDNLDFSNTSDSIEEDSAYTKTGKSNLYPYKLLGKTDDLSDDTEKQRDDEFTVPSSKSVQSEEKYG